MLKLILSFGIACFGSAALAAETITYSYDALGRLIETKVTVGTTTNADTKIVYDAAGNRKAYVVTGTSK